MAYPDPAAPRSDSVAYVVIVAEDADSPGTYRRVQGAYDENGRFALLTSGSGGTVTPPADIGDGDAFGPWTFILPKTYST